MKLDILAVAVHPDDVELGCAGVLMMEKLQGKRVGVIDLTRGELGTRGTAETRAKEAADAAAIMQLDVRENIGMADGFFKNDEAHQRLLIRYIRKYQPEIVLANALDSSCICFLDSNNFLAISMAFGLLGPLLFMVIVTFIGLLMDTCFLRGGLIYFNANPFGLKLSPPWMIALWLNFSIILYVFFKKYFSKFWLCFIVCCCGFPAAYLSGVKLGAARLMHANFSILFITQRSEIY